MTHDFDKAYWDRHWRQRPAASPAAPATTDGDPPNPYLARETSALTPGTALDAGCGGGAEAIWLASHGWHVTAADISAEALALAARRAATSRAPERVRWLETDLSTWSPQERFDLVMTNYAHPAMPQLEFYDRIAEWVAPGGTLLIVGHLHTPSATGHGHGHGHGHHPPAEATVTSAAITTRMDTTQWQIVTAEEHVRTFPGHEGHGATRHDVVVRATRRR
ncbi:class I SAM-dependent methyltransferase [Microbispora sp. RL4-1S]|uniref:Class I SAM-dependent methyltransferase n=1 Tax=Microbispora oryzae TaxID=2806554 RepID=A0A941APN9_9ACTN|nr:class I SAM-dependent methyltransferase [Microbispora oryzae]MBP2703889.1 class I SAM-dependent methyltransferase [Microbispora oryzae]